MPAGRSSDQDPAVAVLAALTARDQTLATAESLTGGGLSGWVTSVPGSSAVYRGGVVSYATGVKEQLLGVPSAVIAEDGVISGGCAVAMACGVRDLIGADWAVSTTGVAGPEPAEGHPAGTVFVGLAHRGGAETRQLQLAGSREEIRSATCWQALTWLAEILGRGEEESRLG